MQKVVNPEHSKTITIDDLVSKLQCDELLMVFYRSNNNRDGIPKFFTKISNFQYGFISPMFGHHKSVFTGSTIYDSISAASKSRNLFVLKKDEVEKLFKLAPLNS